MQVVSVDFGTTNVRIATWDDSKSDQLPDSLQVGQGGASTMPAVIAFQRQTGGAVTTIVGEDADGLEDTANTLVVRNIKRWALASDPFVRWHLESRVAPWPTWWNPQTRSVDVWGQEFPVREVIRHILAESFRRAGLTGDFEWRAGCPVHAGLEYRSELAQVMSEFGDGKKVASVIEEPILFLVLANQLGTLEPGSYLVYDLGGGSFDCALAEVESDRRMIVYASHGHPLLGGVTIDERLTEKLGYSGPPSLLRIAKEQVTRSNPIQAVDADTSVTWNDIVDVLNEEMFLEKTVVAMREAYIAAKVIWKREQGAAPIGPIVQCRLPDLSGAFDKDEVTIILYGGPTKFPLFREGLAAKFGDERVIAAKELLPPEILNPELTALSMGACYASADGHSPLYISRLPARVTLRNTKSGEKVEYKAYQHFVDDFNPAKPFISRCRLPKAAVDAEFELSVANADGAVLESKLVEFSPGDIPPPAVRSPRLEIDTLGQILIDNNGSRWVEIESPPWQTGRQREVRDAIIEAERQHERNAKRRLHHYITVNPFRWGSDVG